MIRRIELTNFMSHERTVLEPAAGLTVLVGPNNCGKSAVVAALQILANNLESNFVLRHGTKECSVVVETDDGHKIEWRRKKSPSYVIDGTTFDRLGKSGLPAELAPALRIKKVEETGHDIHFGEQKSPLFLISESAGNAAKFFAASSDVSRLVAMQNRHKAKLTEAKRRKGELEQRSCKVTRELDALAPLGELNQRLAEQEEIHRQLGQLEQKLRIAARLIADVAAADHTLAQHRAEVTALQLLEPPPKISPTAPLTKLIADLSREQQINESESNRAEVLKPLTTPPELANARVLATLILQLTAATTELDRQTAQQAAIRSLTSPPPLADTAAIASIIEQLQSAALDQARSVRTHDALAPLSAPPALSDVRPLQATIRALATAVQESNSSEQQASSLAALAPAPTLDDTTPLAKAVTQLEAQMRELVQFEREFAAADLACEAAAESLRNWALEQETCPTCGAALDPERVVAGLCGVGGTHGQ